MNERRFTVNSGACTLEAREYIPASNAHPGSGVVLLHGLLSSADVFDVPGLESMSFARNLQRAGVHAMSYDQRGAGASTTDGWQFGLREHALIDLPAVLAECRGRLGWDRVVLAGHSLGGTIWLKYVREAGTTRARPDQPVVVGGVALASPANFDRQHKPWSDIARRGRAFVESIDHNRDAIVTREEFVGAQVTLYWPWASLAFRPDGVRAGLRLGASSPFWAGVMRRLPVPTLIHHKADFDNAAFQRVLQSRTLDRGPLTLLLELVDAVLKGEEGPTEPPIDLPVLCVGSTLDRLVPLTTVEAFARRFAGARVMATEQAYGLPSGHVGYFFKDGLREPVMADVVSHIRRAFALDPAAP